MKQILHIWLTNLCLILPGTNKAIVLVGPSEKGKYSLAASWPEKNAGKHDLKKYKILLHVAQAALKNQKTVIKTRSSTASDTGEPLDALAFPLSRKGKPFGVVALEMTSRSEAMHQDCAAQIAISVKWLHIIVDLTNSMAGAQIVNLVDIVAAALEHEQLKAAVTEVINAIAHRFSCRIAGLGFIKKGRIEIEALSNIDKLDSHTRVAQAITGAMGEAVDQGATVVYPPGPGHQHLAVGLHARLSKILHSGSICTVPLVKNGKIIGAIFFARSGKNPFADKTVKLSESIALLIGPVLELRRQEERSVAAILMDAMRKWMSRFLGPGHLHLKAGSILAAVLIAWLCIATGKFVISSESTLESKVCQAVVAPVNGYIASSNVRAGDLVREGELLASLDDRELRAEKQKWQGQRAQLTKEYRQALSKLDRAGLAILNARRAQAEAQLRLVEQQLTRTKLIAPFSGVIVSGDLSQSIGSPVERGEVLYEVAATDGYRVVIKVDDRDIGVISTGQHGMLKLAGIPDKVFPIAVDHLTPVATVEDGRNFFRVEATMEQTSDLMRPGMEGVARIEIGKRKLIWILTRRMVEWLRLFFWSMLP